MDPGESQNLSLRKQAKLTYNLISPMQRTAGTFEYVDLSIWEIGQVYEHVGSCRFQGPPALCGCVAAACGASATSEKNTPLDFWNMYFVDVVILKRF